MVVQLQPGPQCSSCSSKSASFGFPLLPRGMKGCSSPSASKAPPVFVGHWRSVRSSSPDVFGHKCNRTTAFRFSSLSLSRGCAVEAARKAKPQAVGLAGFSIAKSTSGASLLCAFGSGGVSTTSRQTCRIPILARTARNGGRRCSCLGDTSCCLVVLCLDLRIAALRLRQLHHWHRLLPRRLCQSCPATGERAHEGVRTMRSFVSDLPSLRVVAQIPQTERASLKGAPLVSHSWMQCLQCRSKRFVTSRNCLAPTRQSESSGSRLCLKTSGGSAWQ